MHIKWGIGTLPELTTPNLPLTLRMARYPNQVRVIYSYLGISSVRDVFDALVWDAIILAIACVGCALCLIFFGIVLWNRKHPAIVIAPLAYLISLIVGASILFVFLIIAYLPSDAFNCFFKLVLLLLGVSIING